MEIIFRKQNFHRLSSRSSFLVFIIPNIREKTVKKLCAWLRSLMEGKDFHHFFTFLGYDDGRRGKGGKRR
ncbi:hypothetical protein BRO54_1059 [Geobacillus proteiniphilus]|uniref:Uncharacterized protein n=1 Tax=Geobacillus proteiniphilus TaxID=860353 RepID=A0A1Q5T4W7_9BACL|nr:hypothetical protein BRO54_1059 [Geobacillus proteiniphilus]